MLINISFSYLVIRSRNQKTFFLMSQNNNTTTIVSVIAIIAVIGGIAAFASMNKTEENKMMSNSTMSNSSQMMTDKNMMKDAGNMMKDSVMVGGAAMFKNKDIVSNVVNAPNLTTLVTAVKAAGLVETLQGPGPFTVFGPNNDAFAALPAGTVESLVKPENKSKLVSILTYHVVPGKYAVEDLKDGQMLPTVQGEMLTVKKTGGKTFINDAEIETPNVFQSNGVAHVIKKVLLMPETANVGGAAMFRNKDIVSNVVNAPNLTTLVTAVKAAGLVETLQGPGPFTVFGPDNAAFAKVDKATLESLLMPENKAKLASVLTYHVVSGNILASSFKDGQTLKTVQGGTLTVMKSGDKIMLKDENGGMSTITQADVLQSNGVAHVIDSVLLPKM